MGVLLVVMFVVFVAIGVPISFALGFISFVGINAMDTIPNTVVFTKMFNGMTSFTLLAVPLFILAANLMNEGDAAMEYLKSLCVKSGFGICYHYVFPKEDVTARKKAKRQSQAPTEVICFTLEEIQ